MLRRTATTALSLALLSPTGAWADERCPETIPADKRERRAQAKEWFSKAESAEAAIDLVGASKAYQCSIRMVPHAFTAYNLGRVSEKAGDLELALQSYKTYLELAPEAVDRVEVEGKVAALEARIAAVTAPAAAPLPASEPERPLPRRRALPAPSEPEVAAARFGLLGWSSAGVGVAALASGVALNLSARSKMTDCRRAADRGQSAGSWGHLCDQAKTRAYGSYALLGVAGAAFAVDAFLLLRQPEGRSAQLSMAPISGGAAFVARGRF